MTYEDMTLVQLKSLCKDRGLGTGRSKSELIKKLTGDDQSFAEVQNMTEDEIDELIENGEPVDIEPAPQTEISYDPEDPRPQLYHVSFPHVGFLLDSDHEKYRRLTWEAAKEDGKNPFGGPTAPRLISSAKDQLTYEIEVQ